MKNQIKILSAAVAGSLVLMGCQNPDGTRNNTTTGLLIGTATGVATGVLASDKGDQTRNAIIGGAIGAIAGGGIGYTLDEQEKALRDDLAGSGALIQNTGNKLVVTLPEAITFPVDGATVKSSLMPTLASLAGNLNEYPGTLVQIVGHTDNTGSDSYNQALSERRAQAVSSILQSNGVPAGRLQSIGMGETAPIGNNSTEEGRQANRRVEINIIPTS